jgi:hypothetical protein
MPGFREIYYIAGPFADPRKDRWAQLLLERAGKVGVGIASNLTALLTAKPSKHTIIALAILGTILALTLITGVHAGKLVDAIG